MIIGKTRTNQPVESDAGFNAQVEELVEGGTLDNAKPIYWHNIRFQKSRADGISFVITGVILNNSETALTRDDMFELLKVDGFVMLAVSGMTSIVDGETLTNHVIDIRRKNDSDFYIDYFTSTGGIATVEGVISNTVFIDLGVNKIN